MESDLCESNEKVKTLCETVIQLENKLNDSNNQLKVYQMKCDQLSKDNEKLSGIEEDLSKQVCLLIIICYVKLYQIVLYIGMFLITK